MGVKTLTDGTLSLNTTTFQAALEKDPNLVAKLFSFSGDSTSSVVTVQSGTSKTATGSVDFHVTDYNSSSGVAKGYFGTNAADVLTSDAKGNIVRSDGLTINVTGTGDATLTLGRGAGQVVQDLVTNLTSSDGLLFKSLANIDIQNKNLTTQIDSGVARLAKRKVQLQAQFSKMEVAVAQMKAAAGRMASA